MGPRALTLAGLLWSEYRSELIYYWSALFSAFGFFSVDLLVALTLESGSPDALCPDLPEARAAVAARLGTLRIDRAGWRARYTIGHTPDSTRGDFIHLELFDPDGGVRLQRDLPMTGRSCSDMAHAVALVLDRYYRTLTAETPPEPVSEAPAQISSEASPPISKSAGPTVDSPASVPENPVRRLQHRPETESTSAIADFDQRRIRRLLVEGGIAMATRPTSGGLSVSVGSEVVRRLELGLQATVLLGQEEEQFATATISAHNYPLRLFATYGLARGTFDVQIGPEVLAAVEVARTFDARNSKARFLFGIGGRLTARTWTSPRLGFGLTGGLDFPVKALSGRFLSGQTEVLAPGPTEGFLGLELISLLLE